jgi:hypothetical protein
MAFSRELIMRYLRLIVLTLWMACPFAAYGDGVGLSEQTAVACVGDQVDWGDVTEAGNGGPRLRIGKTAGGCDGDFMVILEGDEANLQQVTLAFGHQEAGKRPSRLPLRIQTVSRLLKAVVPTWENPHEWLVASMEFILKAEGGTFRVEGGTKIEVTALGGLQAIAVRLSPAPVNRDKTSGVTLPDELGGGDRRCQLRTENP